MKRSRNIVGMKINIMSRRKRKTRKLCGQSNWEKVLVIREVTRSRKKT